MKSARNHYAFGTDLRVKDRRRRLEMFGPLASPYFISEPIIGFPDKAAFSAYTMSYIAGTWYYYDPKK